MGELPSIISSFESDPLPDSSQKPSPLLLLVLSPRMPGDFSDPNFLLLGLLPSWEFPIFYEDLGLILCVEETFLLEGLNKVGNLLDYCALAASRINLCSF